MTVFIGQGIQRMNMMDIQSNAQGPWLPRSRPPSHAWLVSEHSELDQHRLKMLGNIVMPQCARAALHLQSGEEWF